MNTWGVTPRQVERVASMARSLAHLVIFVFLTLLTQTGGLAYLVAVLLVRRLVKGRTAVFFFFDLLVFIGVYSALSGLAYFTAPHFGRVSLPCTTTGTLIMQSPAYCLLNRQFVKPELLDVAQQLAEHMDQKFPGTVTIALDAGFPFVDGFPLLPHLSHNDGRKLDLAFYYRTPRGDYTSGTTKSPIGYWAFERPMLGEVEPCKGRNDIITMRWNMRWFESLLGEQQLDTVRTREMLRWLATTGRDVGVGKVFVEPHLKSRLGVNGQTIRFQGCRAARHDDHVHLQLAR